MKLRTIDALDVQNKVVLLRLDLNVPRTHGHITDYTRIIRIIPTIRYLQAKQAKIVILSHLGRPKGKFNRDMSLAPITDALETHLGHRVQFCTETIGNKPKQKISLMRPGEVLLLENLRFDAGEEACISEFASSLAQLGEIFINDTFSCSHRNHASISLLPKLLPSAAGLALHEELASIEALVGNPSKPLTAIIGGAKISTKTSVLKALAAKADYMVIGGAMANNFLAARKINIGASLFEADLLEETATIMTLAEAAGCKIILPEDVIISDSLENPSYCSVSTIKAIEAGQMILDLGPNTVNLIHQIIASSQSLIWNGPVGAFEYAPFNNASISIARSIAYNTRYNNLASIAGGGDTLSVIKEAKLIDGFSYLSTGGGAFLEWLEGGTLPGLTALAV